MKTFFLNARRTKQNGLQIFNKSHILVGAKLFSNNERVRQTAKKSMIIRQANKQTSRAAAR